MSIGLTAEEARAAAGLSVRTCYWKRCSELRQMGLIADTGEERPGDSDQLQMVSAITSKGFRIAEELTIMGGAMFPPLPPSARNADPDTSHKSAASPPRMTRAKAHVARLLVAYYDELMTR